MKLSHFCELQPAWKPIQGAGFLFESDRVRGTEIADGPTSANKPLKKHSAQLLRVNDFKQKQIGPFPLG